MLVPAISRKDEVVKHAQQLLFTDKAMYWNGAIQLDGDLSYMCEVINDRYNYAIINNNDIVIGYFSYRVEYYDSSVYGVQFISFTDKAEDKAIIANDLRTIFKEFERFHRIEFRCAGGNPAEKRYDRINLYFKSHAYNKITLRDVFKDKYGSYRNEYIYEFIKEE